MNPKVKGMIFGAVVLVALALIIGLVVHRSSTRDRLCENGGEAYSNATGEEGCYTVRMQWHCGKLMVFDFDKTEGPKAPGVCGCDVDHFDRTMVYHQESDQCYFIFTQAFCKDGEWLNVAKSGPFCEERKCPENSETSEMVPLKDGRCVELDKNDSKTCNSSTDVVKFFRKQKYPSCKKFGVGISNVGGVPSTSCPQGYFSTQFGHCQPDFDFD